MTLVMILNIVFAIFVLVTIPGMLALAIRRSRREPDPARVALRRARPRPVTPRPVTDPGRGRRSPARTRTLAS